MIKSASNGAVSLGLSPVRGNAKHSGTPLKIRRKTCRKENEADVHTMCSTPNRLQSGNPCSSSSLNSPSDSFPCSQDNRPDVIWDYTSPKLPKGAKKREIKITVDEFLKSLNHNQASECNTQNSYYIKLLEKWMAKQNTPVCAKKPVRTVKRDGKMRSRRVFEEIKQFMESIQQNSKDKTTKSDSSREDNTDENNPPNTEHPNQPSSSIDRLSFLEGDRNENDPLEELWGEADNSFIVKATQQLEASCLTYNAHYKNTEIMSTIPETVTNNSISKHEVDLSTEKDSNKSILDSDHQAQILLTQIMSCNWESDSEFEEFENAFLMSDAALSLIPDELLCDTVNEQVKGVQKANESAPVASCSSTILTNNRLKSNCGENRSCEISFGCSESKIVQTNEIAPVTSCSGTILTANKFKHSSSENRSCEISFGCSNSNITPIANGLNEVELFNNFEDESFGDESILCKPEVLSWIDEVESKLSQSQRSSPELSQGTKCTPEEIKRKKAEAIQRRKRNQLKNK